MNRSSVDNHTQATLNADRLALRRQQDIEYANALAEDLAHQRLTEQEGEENPVDMNAIRAARLERFAPTHVDELSSEPPTDTHSRRHNRQHSQQRRQRERQAEVASGANTVSLGTQIVTDTNAEWQRGAASEARQPVRLRRVLSPHGKRPALGFLLAGCLLGGAGWQWLAGWLLAGCLVAGWLDWTGWDTRCTDTR